MNAHTPFDANQDWTNPYCQNSSNDPMVDALLGNAYHVVRTVYYNLGNLKLIYDFLNQYGMVLGVQSEAELKALTTKAKYARIYGFSRAGDRQVTDYLYVDGDRTGIIPDDSEATGSWVTVATSGSGGSNGDSSGEGAYIPWVYANGSATGGETTINVPDNTVGVPFIIVNGDMQYVGRGFEFNADSLSVTLAQPLEEGDEVVFLLTGTPAVPDNPNVSDWVQINWLYNNGAAIGGEQVITIPYTFQSIPAVYKNGLRLYKGLTTESYTTDPDNQRILLTEPLATNDRLIVQIGGEAQVLETSDHTLQEVARATNVKDSEVILSTDTTQFLNDKKVVFSVSEQKAYGLPSLPTNVYISSVSNGQLTYSPGNITVDLVPTPNSYENLAAPKGAGEIGYDPAELYDDGTVGEMLEDLTDRTLSMDDFSGSDVGIQINAGLDFLRSQNTTYKVGGRLNLPRRQMSLDTPIVFDRVPAGEGDTGDEYLISGSGKGSTLLVAASGFPAGSAILNTNLPSGKYVQGFKLKDLGTKGGYNGLRVETASRTTIDNFKVSTATSDGVYIGNSWVNIYSQVLADQCIGNGVNFSVSAQKTSTTTIAGYQLKNGGNGWRFGFMNYSAAIAPASDQNAGHGYAIAKSEGFVMVAPGAESNKGAGIMVEASSSLGENRSIAIHGAFCHNNGSGTYANLLHAVSAQNTPNRVRIADSTAHDSIGTTPDIIADGNETVVIVDNCVLPNGWQSRNGGYIDWVHHTLYTQKSGVSGPVAVCNLRSTQGHGNNSDSSTESFAGEVTIVASVNPPSTAARRVAIYKLLVCSGADTGKECELIKQLGYVSGNLPGTPSFTWSIGSSNELIATPIGSAAGTFYFEITTDSQVVALKR